MDRLGVDADKRVDAEEGVDGCRPDGGGVAEQHRLLSPPTHAETPRHSN